MLVRFVPELPLPDRPAIDLRVYRRIFGGGSFDRNLFSVCSDVYNLMFRDDGYRVARSAYVLLRQRSTKFLGALGGSNLRWVTGKCVHDRSGTRLFVSAVHTPRREC